ncbi:IS21 family transposase [Psychrobium sp. nBUS_13]|uniref:IS21 family transposase n=1 Tax=Psychrobium sp. nBUS_13 TaxID=3395319 RepID=UPI003EC0679B
MLTKELFVNIKVLHKQGKSIRAIAKELNVSRNTVRKYLRGYDVPHYTKRHSPPTKLSPFHEYIQGRIDAAKPHWIPAVVLLSEIKSRGYQGGITQLRVYLSPFKQLTPEPIVRFETVPGQQMQIDFTTIKRGKLTIKAFVATLGYSRACYVYFYDHERTEAWMDGLREAFHYFGGVPKQVLCDNAKALVIERDVYGEGKHRWNQSFLDLAEEYGFQPKACRPYRAKTKGKVERFNHYLKNSFVVPLHATLKQAGLSLDCANANSKIGGWLNDVAHQRIHGTTAQKPQYLLDEEVAYLQPLPQKLHSSLDLKSSALVSFIAPIDIECYQHPISVYSELLEQL